MLLSKKNEKKQIFNLKGSLNEEEPGAGRLFRKLLQKPRGAMPSTTAG